MTEVQVDPWHDAAAPLEKLAELVGFPGYETPEAWKCNGEFETSRLTAGKLAAFEDLLSELVERYGDAVELQIRHDTWVDIELDPQHPRPALEKFRTTVQEDLTLTLDVTIRKSVVAARWGLINDAITTRLYFFSEQLVKSVSGALTKLDSGRDALFQDPGRKLVILIPGHDIELDGARLAIIGGIAMTRWKQAIPAVPLSEPLAPLSAQQKVHWIGFQLQTLTPQHLAVEPKLAADSGAITIATALYAHLFVCSLIYLARQTTKHGDGSWTSTFISERQEIAIDLAAAPAVTTKAAWRSALSLAGMAQWTYGTPTEADDRLIIVQRVAVDALQNNTAALNGTEIIRLAEELFERARWGWESYLAGELKKYLSQQKELEETVEKTTRDFSDQVQALTKSVTDSVLAAVAVIVGSFIVAVFKTPFQEVVFQVATSVYAVYLLVFPMFFGLRTAWERFQKSRDTFAVRRENFEKRLTRDPVKKIVEPLVPNTEKWFRKWYWSTVVAYCMVLVVLVAGIVGVPPLVQRWSDDFTLASASADRSARVVIRGRNFDKEKAIVVTHGRTTFTNLSDPPTLRVHGSTVLTFTANKSELATPVVKISQGTVGPKEIVLR